MSCVSAGIKTKHRIITLVLFALSHDPAAVASLVDLSSVLRSLFWQAEMLFVSVLLSNVIPVVFLFAKKFLHAERALS